MEESESEIRPCGPQKPRRGSRGLSLSSQRYPPAVGVPGEAVGGPGTPALLFRYGSVDTGVLLCSGIEGL